MFCNNCGKELPDGAKFCTGCGKEINSAGGKSSLRKIAVVLLSILLIIAVAAAVFFMVVMPKMEKDNQKNRIDSDRGDDDDEEEEEEENEKEEKEAGAEKDDAAKETADETDDERSGDVFVQIAAKEALIDCIREIESSNTSVYAVRDFDGDGIYELFSCGADMSAEIGRFAYDGTMYQGYGTSDEGWNFYGQEGDEEYYPYRDMMAFLDKDVPLPEMPGWLSKYAKYLEGWEVSVPIKISLVSVEGDEIPECMAWIECDNDWDDWECYMLRCDEGGVEESYVGYNMDYITCQEGSGKFCFVCLENGVKVWYMMNFVDAPDLFEYVGSAYEDGTFSDYGDEVYKIAGADIVEGGEYNWWELEVSKEEFLEYIADYTGDMVVSHEDGVQAYYGNYEEAMKGAYALWLAEHAKEIGTI